ncbi:hypothetical protein BBO99_00002054 [Phytophthora kernoviae]|uniref:Uncharacterized protein n=2 Tax=Phytophthora kernoviae TaxID=325452 RepID=A0A3R7GWD7_9STRA|nr:hypothetical protein G195_010597 [Phytophthora kernoviae 00238/432]KAG2530373.1 hypothetical protein JM16_001617 [Phytophthora kernoviae]KAG2532546.1 hypothetical protein JM18_000450 [Phytophthora kernoviae]RLN45469.1 hypothetical protein BBI17_001941 [Phytophthora kernoviae]RLN83526.1 hypothetical protein BBO99_00002054 [Phytophthora kernoviae]
MSNARSPPLCRSNVLWWSRTYGYDKKHRGQCTLPIENPTPAASSAHEQLYRFIRDNQVERVQRFVDEHPSAVFTKRTPLFVASFFGRHEIVKLLLRRGADKDLPCDGVRPIDVAGYAAVDPVDRMKVQSLLHGNSCPQVIVRLDERRGAVSSADSTSETRAFRLQIHFSERVDEFTMEDITTSEGCVVSAFSMLRGDLYLATVQLFPGVSAARVEVPAGVARRHQTAGVRCIFNASSGPFHVEAV